MTAGSKIVVGVISDTHGLVRPEALRALEGVEHILHAGDVGSPDVLEALRELAPLTAVRGNVDASAWASDLPETVEVSIGDARLYLLHDRARLDLDPEAAGLHAVVSGHSHRPRATSEDGVLFLNPGSAGPRRFRLPIALALLTIEGTRLDAELLELEV